MFKKSHTYSHKLKFYRFMCTGGVLRIHHTRYSPLHKFVPIPITRAVHGRRGGRGECGTV